MRKLISCLLVAGLVVAGGCKKHDGTGAGTVAADDPLTYVPSDTPYVIANIEPVPADVSAEWISRFDKAGKMGDIYANQLDAAAQLLRSKGDKTQDQDECQANADALAAAKAATATSEDASSQSTGTAAPPDCAKTAELNAAQRDKSIKLIDAVKAEVAGKDMQGLMDLAGVSPQSHAAVYGIGVVPVLRIELLKPDNLRATIGRIEAASGSKLATAKVGALDYWIVDGGKADSPLRGVFAISGKQLVATIAPLKAGDADLRVLFGLDKPAKSLAQSGDLAALNKRLGYLTYGSGYFDSARLMAVLKAPPTPLETSFLNAMGEKKPSIDPVCAAEYDTMAANWPRASFGYTEMTTKHMGLRGVLETKPDIAKDLMRLRAPMPGMVVAQNALFDFGFSANLVVLPELATKYADANAKSPWKCPQLAGLNEGFEKSKNSLTNPAFAGYAPMFHGFHAMVDTLVMKDGPAMPDFSGLIAIGSDNPASLLAMAGSVSPGIAQLGLKPDGVPKALPPIPGSPMTQPMQAAMTDKLLAVSIGAGEEAKLGDIMKVDAAQQPLMTAGGKGEIYHLLAEFQRKTAAALGDPAMKQSMEQQAKMMDTYATWMKRFDVKVELTELGVELIESVDLQ